jgi:hypothetical protein
VQHPIEENLAVSVLRTSLLKSVQNRPHIPRAPRGRGSGICGFKGLVGGFEEVLISDR